MNVVDSIYKDPSVRPLDEFRTSCCSIRMPLHGERVEFCDLGDTVEVRNDQSRRRPTEGEVVVHVDVIACQVPKLGAVACPDHRFAESEYPWFGSCVARAEDDSVWEKNGPQQVKGNLVVRSEHINFVQNCRIFFLQIFDQERKMI